MYKPRDDSQNQRYEKKKDDEPRKNGEIRAKEVLLIDENGESLGVTSIEIAMSKAKEAQMDLVEVGSKATPPVCRIIDYSKYVYEQRKKQKQNKKAGKVKPMKEFKFSPVIEENDTNHRVKRAKEYLDKGHNVRLTMYRKGRQSQEQANSTFEEILTKFEGYSSIEPEPKKEGRKIFMTFKSDSNGKSKKTKQNKEDSTKEAKKDKS
jgi:translation initiation factor IF-3